MGVHHHLTVDYDGPIAELDGRQGVFSDDQSQERGCVVLQIASCNILHRQAGCFEGLRDYFCRAEFIAVP